MNVHLRHNHCSWAAPSLFKSFKESLFVISLPLSRRREGINYTIKLYEPKSQIKCVKATAHERERKRKRAMNMYLESRLANVFQTLQQFRSYCGVHMFELTQNSQALNKQCQNIFTSVDAGHPKLFDFDTCSGLLVARSPQKSIKIYCCSPSFFEGGKKSIEGKKSRLQRSKTYEYFVCIFSFNFKYLSRCVRCDLNEL